MRIPLPIPKEPKLHEFDEAYELGLSTIEEIDLPPNHPLTAIILITIKVERKWQCLVSSKLNSSPNY